MMYGHFQEDRFVGQLYSSTAHDNYNCKNRPALTIVQSVRTPDIL